MTLDEYKDGGNALYRDFAESIATMLSMILNTSLPAFHYQHIQRREKSIASLEGKIGTRANFDSLHIEKDIKDLAGCRVIFYANLEAQRFERSGLISEQFGVDWQRTKMHHPVPGHTPGQFRSDNIVVFLKDEQAALPAYARFKGLLCEVQIQTILNHAWADTAHAVTYKRPSLTGLGEKLLIQIDQRLDRIMTKYLMPAGHEFQKVWNDYEMILKGKALLDQGAVDDLLTAGDNNTRKDRLDSIGDHLLPNLDNLETSYPEICENIAASIEIAREVSPKPIDVLGGSFPGVTSDDYAEAAIELLERYRYVDVIGTWTIIARLFSGTPSDAERKRLVSLADNLSENNIKIWQQVGPSLQVALVDEIQLLSDADQDAIRPLILSVLTNTLKSEVSGTTARHDSVVLSFGSVTPSSLYSKVRSKALSLLMKLYRRSKDSSSRREILNAFQVAAQTPSRGKYDGALLTTILSNTVDVVDFFCSIADSEQFEILQTIEHNVLWYYRRNGDVPKQFKGDAAVMGALNRLEQSIARLRSTLDANAQFGVFKTIVGYESVFPPDWEDDSFEIDGKDTYRQQRLEELVGTISPASADDWLVVMHRCASTVTNDGATFRYYYIFLGLIGRECPDLALRFLLALDESLGRFIPPVLNGLRDSAQSQVIPKLISDWIVQKRFLVPIAHYLADTKPLDITTISGILYMGIASNDDQVVLAAMLAVLSQHQTDLDMVEKTVLAPALQFFTSKKKCQWVAQLGATPRAGSLFERFSHSTNLMILGNLRFLPDIDHRAEFVLIPIASRFPQDVLRMFIARSRLENGGRLGRNYDALPYQFYRLSLPLQQHPELVIETASELYTMEGHIARDHAARLIRLVFPNFTGAEPALREKLASRNEMDLQLIVAVLREFDGIPAIYDLCKDVVEALPEGDNLLSEMRLAIIESDVISGAFGFVELYKERKIEMEKWLADPRAKVQKFAAEYIPSLNNSIAAEQKRAEQQIAARKLEFDESADDNDAD